MANTAQKAAGIRAKRLAVVRVDEPSRPACGISWVAVVQLEHMANVVACAYHFSDHDLVAFDGSVVAVQSRLLRVRLKQRCVAVVVGRQEGQGSGVADRTNKCPASDLRACTTFDRAVLFHRVREWLAAL